MTRQQQLVLDLVKQSHAHPTSEQVLSLARTVLPGIGVATVYRVLDKLSRDGLLRRFVPDGGPAHYDGTLSPHEHVICRCCGRVRDVDLGNAAQLILERAGGAEMELTLSLKETCADCIRAKANGNSQNA